jgi:hypothetical protein
MTVDLSPLLKALVRDTNRMPLDFETFEEVLSQITITDAAGLRFTPTRMSATHPFIQDWKAWDRLWASPTPPTPSQVEQAQKRLCGTMEMVGQVGRQEYVNGKHSHLVSVVARSNDW